MSTAVTPDLVTGGDSSTSVADPIDTLDLSSMADIGVEASEDTTLPEAMVVGKKEPAQETPEEKAAQERAVDGKFTKKEGEAPEPPKTTPFKYRAMSATHEIEGATQDSAGNVIIPAAKQGMLREALNAMHLAQGEYQPVIERYKADNTTLAQRVQELSKGRGEKETRATHILDGVSSIMAIQDDNQFLSAVWQMRADFPRLQSEAKAKYWEEQAKRGIAPPAPAPQNQNHTPAPAAMPAPDVLIAQTKDAIEEFKVHFPAISEADWKQIESESADTPFAFYRLATAEDAKTYRDVQVGQVVFDNGKLRSRIDKITDSAKQAAAAQEAERKRVELAKQNARSTQPSINTPPTAGGGHAPAKAPKGLNSQKEVDDWFNSDKLDLD